ncbi:MAG: DUF1697 domain-containing protein [Gemmatimonadota bacterium]
MPRNVAFLRAINVGGHTVKMDQLRELFAELGFKNVETFIASGNVLFDSPGKATPAMEAKIEKHLQKALGYKVDTFVRPLADLAAVLTHHPFAELEADAHALHVGFMRSPPAADTAAKLFALQSDFHRFHVHDREVYWLTYQPTGESKIGNNTFEKTLGCSATFRNANTVRRLAAKVKTA